MSKPTKDDESFKSQSKSSSNEIARQSPMSMSLRSTSQDLSQHSSLQKSPLLGVTVAPTESHMSPPPGLPDLPLLQTSVSPALRQVQPSSTSPTQPANTQSRKQRLRKILPLPSTMRKLRSSKNKQASDSDDSRQEETVHEILVRNRKESVFERPGPVGLPSQNPLQNPFQDPKTPNQGAQARDAGWASVNPPRDHALSSSVDLEGLRPTIEKWKATPPRKPMNYQPMGFGPPKTEQKSPASPPGNLCENTTRCLNSTYDSDKTTIDHLKRAQKRLREDYEQFEEEVEDSIEVRGIDDRQHKRIRRIRTRLRDRFEELGNDLDNFENKKYNDHKRVLEYLGADPKKSQ